MRVIDADALPKLFDAEFKQTMKLIRGGEKHLDNLAEGFAEAIRIAKYIAPTVDAVPVVRCKDCIHYNKSKRLCCVSGWVHDEDGFCNLGERRTDMEDWNFYEERYRMCKSFDNCADGCPAFDGLCTVKNEFLTDKGIEKVKEWSVTHPRKTRQSALLELFRNVKLDDNGIVDIDTCKIEKYRAKFCPRSKNCSECRRTFWSEEIVL